MKRLLCLLSLLIAAGTPALAQSVYYLPEVIDGPVGKRTAKTAILLVNSNSAEASVAIRLVSGDGSALKLSLPDSVKIPPAGSVVLRTDGSGGGAAGAAMVTSNLPVVVSEVISFYDAAGVLVKETAAPDADPNLDQVFAVDANRGIATGVAIVNPGAGALAVSFHLRDRNGSTAGDTTASVPAGGQSTWDVTGKLFPALPEGFQGTLTVSTATAVPAVAMRRSGDDAAFTLVTSTPLASGKYSIYLPGIADGHGNGLTMRTAFQLFAVSERTAHVEILLVQSDGTPVGVNIPGQGYHDRFPLTIEPGTSWFLETDGAGNGTAAVASVSSDFAIGISAVVTATDEAGNPAGEFAVAQPKAAPCWVAPVENSSAIATRVSIFNPGSNPVTVAVTLKGADGEVAGSSRIPVAAGNQATVTLADLATAGQDFAGNFAGTMAFCASGGIGPAVVPVTFRQDVESRRLAPVAAVTQPAPVNPLNLAMKLDVPHAASATIGAGGGTLNATGADGATFKLVVPAGALVGDAAITMTPVASVTGAPAGAVFGPAVQLSPEGLYFWQPATLEIQPAKPVAAASYLLPIGWSDSGQDVHLMPAWTGNSPVKLPITHFSGAGYASGSQDNMTDYANSFGTQSGNLNGQMAQTLDQARQDGTPMDDPDLLKKLRQLADQEYHQIIEPMVSAALQSQDRTMLNCALQKAREFQYKLALLGLGPTDPAAGPLGAKVVSMISALVKMDEQRCKNHELLAGQLLLQDMAALALIGDASRTAQVLAEVETCTTPAFELTFKSRFWSSDPEIDGAVISKTTIDLKVSPDPAKRNMMVPVGGGASGPLAYQTFYSGLSSGDGCTVVDKTVDSTLTVYSGGRSPGTDTALTFDVNLKGDSNGSKAGADGKPVFCKPQPPTPKIVKVVMNIDPGRPYDGVVFKCEGAPPIEIPIYWWIGGWTTMHIEQQRVFADWEISNGDDFYQTLITKTYDTEIILDGSILHEMTTLELKPTGYKSPFGK
jgi:hypothetical protein